MYIFDSKTQCFFPLALKDRYIAARTWPENGVEVDDDTFSEFQVPPAGKMRVAGSDGLPAWADIPVNHIAEAETQRTALIDAAIRSISVIQLKLQAGRKLTDDETTRLNAVLDYIDAVEVIDTSNALDIEWPVSPQ